jgi:hypothetical protein
MFAPDWEKGCKSWWFMADNFNGIHHSLVKERDAFFGLLGIHSDQFPEEVIPSNESRPEIRLGISSGMTVVVPAWEITKLLDSDESYQVSRFATPVAAKTGTMPAHQRLGPDDRDRLENRWKPAIQLDEEQAIAVRELDPTAHLALQHNQLLPQRGVLCFKLAHGLEERGNQVQEEDYQRGHRGRR